MRSIAHRRQGRSASRGYRLAAILGVFVAALTGSHAEAGSLRFYGKAIGNVNRVMVRIDPHVPADVGTGNFTLEFWMKATAAENVSNGGCTTGSGEGWITGNIIFDRAIWQHDRNGDYGVSMFRNGTGAARLAFGIYKGGSYGQGICGTRNVADGQWHHVAITRASSTGQMRIYVDGQLDAQGTGPTGDISYANGVPSQVPSYINLNVDNYLGIGAEKYDADGTRYPSYSGFLDEVRLSTVLRYTADFTRPTEAFAPDGSTAALWHFDEGSGNLVNDSAPGGASPGERRFGGNPAGPQWSDETPFTVSGTGTLTFSQAATTAGEGSGSATISVSRTGGSSGAASVSYQTSGGSAMPGGDYQGVSGTLAWASGDASPKSFSMTINDDVVDEPDETIGLILTSATGAALGSPANATLTILDDDATIVPGTLQFSASTFSTTESAGSVLLTVTRTGGADGNVAVNYSSASGTATAGADFAASSGLLSWPGGDTTSRTISVPIVDDAAVESTETFSISLSAPTGGATLGTRTTGTVSIADNDVAGPPPPGSLRFSAASQQVAESAGSITLSVSRINGSAGAVTVAYASNSGSAAAPSDYQGVSGTLSWANGDSANKSLTVTVNADALIEGNETFSIALSAPTGGATLSSPSQTTVTITDSTPSSPTTFADDFNRPDHADIGNGWTEMHTGAFALAAGRAQKRAVSVPGDTVVYRPAGENVAGAEASVELRVTSFPIGYPQVFVRLQTSGLGSGGALVRYVLLIDDSPGRAILARQSTMGNIATLQTFNFSPQLNTTDTYRLRIRATGTDPVQLWAAVERLVSGSWQVLGQTTFTDSDAARIRTPGSVGFGGYTESSYSYDNFLRTAQ